MKQETLEEAAYQARRDYQDEVGKDGMNECIMLDAMKIQRGFELGAKWQAERSYSEEDLREILTKLSLVNPSHLKMTIDGYGEFPDSYKLTEKGVNHVIEQFKKKVMEKIPTAEEFVLKDSDGYLAGDYTPKEVYALMIDFAKLHVEEALKAASQQAEIFNKPKFSGDYNLVVDEDSILNSYPLENIK